MQSKRLFGISAGIGLALGALGSMPLGVAAPEPPRQGHPEGHEPGGTRGPCLETELPFTPVLPISAGGFAGTTLEAHPSFWFYVPYTPEPISTGRFSLVSQDGTTVLYRADVTLPTPPGFVEVAVPTTAPALATHTSYQWQFILYCGDPGALVPDFVIHRGTIQRIDETALARPLATDDVTQQVQGLLQNQLWYDATDLAAMQAAPDLWAEVLGAIGLTALESVSTFGRAETVPE